MKVIVVGAGEVGTHITSHLAAEGHDVVLVESNPEKAQNARDTQNALVITGNGASTHVLDSAGAQGADMICAVTDVDEVNIVACVTARTLGIAKRVARVKDLDYYDTGAGRSMRAVGVDIMINPDLAAAREIERLVSLPGASDVSDFGGAQMRMVGMYVADDSRAIGVPLKDLEDRVGPQRATVVAVLRKDKTIVPNGDFTLRGGDHIFLVGETKTMPDVMRHLGSAVEPVRNVMIVGAGPISRHLARTLSRDRVQVKLIELKKEKAERTAGELDKVMVLHGDATDAALLDSENVGEMDAFIAASNDEETNIMSCLLARHMGAGKTIAVMRRSNYVPLMPVLGIDAAISVRLNTAAEIMKLIRKGEIVTFAQLKENEAEAMEFVVHDDSKVCRKPVADLGFPRDAVIGAILRGTEVIIPRGYSRIQSGDRVVVFALPKAVDAVSKFFG